MPKRTAVALTAIGFPLSVAAYASTEEYRYSNGKLATTHQVDGATLRLTESGCSDDDARCVHVSTEAGAVEGRALTSDEVTAPALIRTTTSMGAVELRVPRTETYAVDVHTGVGGGSVRVEKDPASTHRIEVRSEVGTVSVEPLP